jgi:hypothetical protein
MKLPETEMKNHFRDIGIEERIIKIIFNEMGCEGVH